MSCVMELGRLTSLVRLHLFSCFSSLSFSSLSFLPSVLCTDSPSLLPGLALGGAWGFTQGLREPLVRSAATAPSVPIGSIKPTAPGSAPVAPAAAAVNLAKEAVAGAKDAVKETAAGAASAAQQASKISGRLRWNNILNQVTRRGTHMGNSAGVLGTSLAFSPFPLAVY